MSTGLGVNLWSGSVPYGGGLRDSNVITGGRVTSNDGTTIVGSPTITSATAAFVAPAPFVAGDVGKAVNDSQGRLPPGTRITSVTNGTTAVLNQNATASTTVPPTGNGSNDIFTIGTGVSDCLIFQSDRMFQLTDIVLSNVHSAALQVRVAITPSGVATFPNDGQKIFTLSLASGQIFTWSGRIPLFYQSGLIAMCELNLADVMVFGAFAGECLD